MRPRLATGLPFRSVHGCACMPTSLPMGDESAMNFEGVGGLSFAISIVFLTISAYWERTSQRTWLPCESESKKPHRAGPIGLVYEES